MFHLKKNVSFMGLFLVVLSWAALFVSASAYSAFIPASYDRYFKEAQDIYPFHDWRMIKAQTFQESRMNPNARSPVGAEGLMQMMPKTQEEIKKKYPELDVKVWPAQLQIMAGALYMRMSYKAWNSNRTDWSHFKLALAGYNCGNGYLFKAQKLCGNPQEYDPIIKCLKDVPMVKYEEPIDYVQKITEQWYPQIRFGLK